MDKRDIGLLIKKLNDKIKASADASLKEYGITFSQTLIIEFLYNQGGQATQKEIEEHMRVSHPTVVGIISRLEKNGFVICFMEGKNRRKKIVRATDKALNMISIMHIETRKKEKELTKSLSDSEVTELRRMLTTLYKNL